MILVDAGVAEMVEALHLGLEPVGIDPALLGEAADRVRLLEIAHVDERLDRGDPPDRPPSVTLQRATLEDRGAGNMAAGEYLLAELHIGAALIADPLAVLADDDDVRLARLARHMEAGEAAIGHQRARRPPCLVHQVDIGAELLRHGDALTGVAGIGLGPGDRGRLGLILLAHREIVREAAGVEQHAAPSLDRLAAIGTIDDDPGHPVTLHDEIDHRRFETDRDIGLERHLQQTPLEGLA